MTDSPTVRADLSSEIQSVRVELREAGLQLEAEIEAIKAGPLNGSWE